MTKIATLSYGEKYEDGSGWRWLVEYIADDSYPVRIHGGSSEYLMFRAEDAADLRAMAQALVRLADAAEEPGA